MSWESPRSAERLPGRDAHLGLHEVDVGDLLGDRVLDLDARVHLDEHVAAAPGRAGTPRCRRCGSRSRSRTRTASAHIRSRIAGSRFGAGAISTTFWCRRCTEQSRSNRWIDVAGAVGEDLHLDVPRLDDGLLDEHGRVAERALGLAHAGLDRPRAAAPRSSTRRMPRPPPPATALTNSGKRHALRRLDERRRRRWTARPTRASERRPPCAAAIARALLPVSVSTSAVGPMKVMPALAHASASCGVLRQEAVAGVDRVGAGVHRGARRSPRGSR